MPLTSECHVCRTKLRIPDNAVGGMVKCPICSTILVIPTPLNATPSENSLPSTTATLQPPARKLGRPLFFMVLGGGALAVLLLTVVLFLAFNSRRMTSGVEASNPSRLESWVLVSVDWITPNGIVKDDNPVAVLVPKDLKEKIDVIAPIYAGEAYKKVEGPRFRKCGAYVAVGFAGITWFENVDRGSYTLIVFPNSFDGTIDEGISEEEASRAEQQLQPFFTRVRRDLLRRKPIFIRDIEVKDFGTMEVSHVFRRRDCPPGMLLIGRTPEVRHEFRRRVNHTQARPATKNELTSKQVDGKVVPKSKQGPASAATEVKDPEQSNDLSRDQQRTKLLAQFEAKKREALPTLEEENRRLEAAMEQLRKEEADLRQNPQFGDPFNNQVMSQFNALLKKQRDLAIRIQNAREELDRKVSDFEQDRRKILLKFPAPSDPKFIEYKGLIYTQEELTGLKAYEKEHADPRIIADTYMALLGKKGLVSRPKFSGLYKNPKSKDSYAVAFKVASVNGRKILGDTVHLYVFKDKQGYWQISAFSPDGVHVMLGPPPREFQQVSDPGKEK